MVRIALSLLIGLAVPLVSFAQAGCPAGAWDQGVVAADSRVRVLGVSSEDEYYAERKALIGKQGRVDRMDPTGGYGDCWYGGQFYADDGNSYFFFQVAIAVLAGGQRAGSCPSGAYSGAAPAAGTQVKVLTVSPEDAYYATRYTVDGLEGEVRGAWAREGEPCWYGGEFLADDGTTRYFYQAAFEVTGGTARTACPVGAEQRDRLVKGTRVKVLALHGDDAYAGDSARIVGLTGTVGDRFTSKEACWMEGAFTADNGQYYFFAKAAVDVIEEAPGSTCPPGATTRAVQAGTRVKVLGIHPDDHYFAQAADVIGVEGVVESQLTPDESCWLSGSILRDDGEDYYFYRAAVVVRGGNPVAAGERYMGGSVKRGKAFRIVAIHPDDTYHDDRATLIGLQCTAGETMVSQGPGWFSGSATCGDRERYFYKVGLVLD